MSDTVEIRDRVRELRRVPAGDLKANPKNWRTHPDDQRRALAGVLESVGFADAVLARELEDGTLELIDGHLRADELPPDYMVPVLVLDLSADEADVVLATHDPLAALAGRDGDLLSDLIDSIQTDNADLARLLRSIELDDEIARDVAEQTAEEIPASKYSEQYGVIVLCEGETHQQTVYAELLEAGHTCRVVVT